MTEKTLYEKFEAISDELMNAGIFDAISKHNADFDAIRKERKEYKDYLEYVTKQFIMQINNGIYPLLTVDDKFKKWFGLMVFGDYKSRRPNFDLWEDFCKHWEYECLRPHICESKEVKLTLEKF